MYLQVPWKSRILLEHQTKPPMNSKPRKHFLNSTAKLATLFQANATIWILRFMAAWKTSLINSNLILIWEKTATVITFMAQHCQERYLLDWKLAGDSAYKKLNVNNSIFLIWPRPPQVRKDLAKSSLFNLSRSGYAFPLFLPPLVFKDETRQKRAPLLSLTQKNHFLTQWIAAKSIQLFFNQVSIYLIWYLLQ